MLFSRFYSKSIGVKSLTFRITWSHRLRLFDSPVGHFLLMVLWNQGSISIGFRDIQWLMWRNGSSDPERPLNKRQGHSFWYQSIYHIRLPIVNSNFCSETHRLATTHNVTDRRQTATDRRTQHCSMSATVSTVG